MWTEVLEFSGKFTQMYEVDRVKIWVDEWEFASSSAWNPSSEVNGFDANALMLKGADVVTEEAEEDLEEGSGKNAAIASASIFGFSICAYFLYKRCMNVK